MPISTYCLEAFTNSCIASGPDCLKTQQLAGIPTAIETAAVGCSVANVASLPSAPDNEGRMIFVEDIGAYRYSNGFEWLNNYSTTTQTKYRLFSAGNNVVGSLGINLSDIECASSSSFVREITLSENWCQISIRDGGTQAIKSDGTLWNWGCLYGSTNLCFVNTSSPIQETSLSTNWCLSSGGGITTTSRVSAIKTDGTLWSWGLNQCGELGIGVTCGFNTVISPIQEISSSTDWSDLSVFKFTQNSGTIALKTDGTLWGWGRNFCGSLGVNNITCYSSPVQEISSSTDWCKIAAGSGFSTAIKTSGTLWSVGSGFCGKLATNNTVCYSSPVQEVTSSADWCMVNNGQNHAIAIKTDSSLWGWGCGNQGQIGNNSNINRSSPVQEISSSTNWCTINAGAVASVGIKTDSTLWGWGLNCCGLFGSDQIPTNSLSSPTQIPEIEGWCAAAVSQSRAVFILAKQIGFNEP